MVHRNRQVKHLPLRTIWGLVYLGSSCRRRHREMLDKIPDYLFLFAFWELPSSWRRSTGLFLFEGDFEATVIDSNTGNSGSTLVGLTERSFRESINLLFAKGDSPPLARNGELEFLEWPFGVVGGSISGGVGTGFSPSCEKVLPISKSFFSNPSRISRYPRWTIFENSAFLV